MVGADAVGTILTFTHEDGSFLNDYGKRFFFEELDALREGCRGKGFNTNPRINNPNIFKGADIEEQTPPPPLRRRKKD